MEATTDIVAGGGASMSNAAINDFIAEFMSDFLRGKGIDVSPLEIELLYFFKKNQPIEKSDVESINKNISRKTLSNLLNKMEKSGLIVKNSPYQLSPNGDALLNKCFDIQRKVEPMMKSNVFFYRLERASTTTIKI